MCAREARLWFYPFVTNHTDKRCNLFGLVHGRRTYEHLAG